MFFTKVLHFNPYNSIPKNVFNPITGRTIKANDKIVEASPSKFYRKHQTLRFAWNRRSRPRTCFTIARISVQRGLMFSTINRKLYKDMAKELWKHRINAGAAEHGLDCGLLLEGLARSEIHLNKQTLSNLAIYEPRTFECLSDIAKLKCEEEGIDNPATPRVTNIKTNDRL